MGWSKKEDSLTICTSMRCHVNRDTYFEPLGEVEGFVRPGGSGARVGITSVSTECKCQWVGLGYIGDLSNGDLRSNDDPRTRLRYPTYAIDVIIDLVKPTIKLFRESGAMVSVP